MTTEVRNILKVYRQATEAEHKHGTTWYAKAQAQAQAIADKHVVPLRVVVGVIAALSPNNKWERNVNDADQMLSAFLRGDPVDVCKPSTYTKMRDKAWSVIEGMPEDDEAVIQILNGAQNVSHPLGEVPLVFTDQKILEFHGIYLDSSQDIPGGLWPCFGLFALLDPLASLNDRLDAFLGL